MPTRQTYEDAMRVHDVAFYKWLANLKVDYGNLGGSEKKDFPILRVYASPMRAYASLVDILVEQGFVEGADAEEMRQRAKTDFAVLPLPLATIERDEPTLDPELPGTAVKELRTMEWDAVTQQYVKHPFPAHYRTEYRVTFWCLKKYTDAWIREWLYGLLGQRGAAENECFIPVVHDAPWGEIQHALKFTGSSNLSDLEGDGARYLRHEYTFSLRTWIMKPSVDGAHMVETVGADKYLLAGDDGALLEEMELGVQSMNLFRLVVLPTRVPELWPTDGDAVVDASVEFPDISASYVPFTFKMGVTDQDDKVHLVEIPSRLDGDDLDLFSLAFQYRTTGRVELEIFQRDLAADTVSSADSLILPATEVWKKVHFFSLVNDGSYLARIAGIPNQDPQVVHVSDVDARHLYAQTKVAPDDSVDLGDFVKYRWFSLARDPYLCIIAVTTTIGGINEVTVEDDASAPAYTAGRVIDSSVNVGLVFLVQPKTSSLALRVPKTTTVSAVYVQRFNGPYNGHEV